MSTQHPITPMQPMKGPSWGQVYAFLLKLFVWGTLFAVLFVLRSFFLLIFLTFLFAYLQDHGVHLLGRYKGPRWLRVTVAAILLLSVLSAIGSYLVPRIIEQAELYADKYPDYLQEIDETIIELSNHYPILKPLLGSGEGEAIVIESPSARLLRALIGGAEHGVSEDGLRKTIGLIRGIGQTLLAIGSAFFLALLFSFLIVLDLPRLSEGVRSFRDTRVGWVYDEVAESIANFGRMLGRAIEAQLIIAIINTLLTAVLIQFLGIADKTAFLSLIVFLCSFIPVAGVFISSVPICLSVLPVGGLGGVGLAILFIWIIHMIEGYILNPKIYGHHMRMNPVIVLIILTVAGKLFHIWGLVLGVPVCTYIFVHVIQRKPVKSRTPRPEDKRNRPL